MIIVFNGDDGYDIVSVQDNLANKLPFLFKLYGHYLFIFNTHLIHYAALLKQRGDVWHLLWISQLYSLDKEEWEGLIRQVNVDGV